VSDLPDGWVWVKTAELFTFVTSGSRGWAKYYSDDGALFIRIGNLQRNSIAPDLSDIRHVAPPSGSEGSRTQVRENDILISITADIGRVAVMSDVREMCYINQHIALARPIAEIDARYLAWHLSSATVQHHWMNRQRGATKLGLGLDDIKSVDVPLPPKAVQKGIVAVIEEQFSRLDAGTSALERVEKNIERLRSSILKAATNGTLADCNPAHWTTGRLADIATIASGQTPRGLELLDHGPVPFYKVGDMNFSAGKYMAQSRGYLDQATAKQFGLHIRPAGTVIFPKRGGAIATNKKRILQAPAAYDLNTMGLIPGLEISSEFLYLWISAINLSQLADGSNVPQINNGDLVDLQISIPSRIEQDQVVAAASEALSRVDMLSQAVDLAKARSRYLRASVLTTAMSGNLALRNEEIAV
jgi:restriction endonuclease S subunit